MSDIIRLLPDHVANQIAAGEVVQRPASVIKELMENAVDAGAEHIEVVVTEAGRSLIQVSDDGSGMSATDARLSFERHATSKISSTDDIFGIVTKGFRGEALASIAAVAQVEMQTKQEQEELGHLIKIEGGKLISQEASPSAKGTKIAVKNLFFNVPARRAFLKSDQVEFRHILDEYHRVALAHPAIDFRLNHNGDMIYYNRPGNRLQRILQIFGNKHESSLIPINEDTEQIQLEGFVGKPDLSKKSKGMQFFFVNDRFIKSPYLHRAILQAYDHLLPPKHHPAYFIYLKIDPKNMDINIHPTKTEVKFTDDRLIYSVLSATIKRGLGKFQVQDTLDFDQPEELNKSFFNSKTPPKTPHISVDRSFNPFEPTAQSGSTKSEKKALVELYADHINWEKEEAPQEKMWESEEQTHSESKQWKQSYLLSTKEDHLRILDQHRVHQSILFHEILASLSKNAASQQLLFPVEIPLDKQDILQLQIHSDNLFALGFDFEWKGDLLQVNAVPTYVSQSDITAIFMELFNEDAELPDNFGKKEQLAASMAKACAIKKGEKLENSEIAALEQAFEELGNPQYSPFGKKNYIRISLEEIKKQF